MITELTVYLEPDSKSRDLGDRGVSIIATEEPSQCLRILIHDPAFLERYSFAEVLSLLSEESKQAMRKVLENGRTQNWYVGFYRAMCCMQTLSWKDRYDRALLQIARHSIKKFLPDDAGITYHIIEELAK